MSISKSVLAKMAAALVEYRIAKAKAKRPGPEWFSIQEYSTDTGATISSARNGIRDLVQAGKVESRKCGTTAYFRARP